MSKPVVRIRTTYVNPNTALHTAEITEGWEVVRNWILAQGFEPAEKLRKYRVNKAGRVTFKHGCGYSILDADLLGGNGDGRTLDKFRADTGARIVYP